MKVNIAHFQEKIEEMQRKLNMINDNIEEIKNGRNILEENKKSCKNNDFLKNNIKKKNHLKTNNNNSINFFNKKNIINYEFSSIPNDKYGKKFYKNKNSFSNINLMNNYIYNIPKNRYNNNPKLNINNEEKKFMNYPFEDSKNETPTFFKNSINYKNYKICINKDYSNERLANNSNLHINNNKIRKINSASEIMNSVSAVRSHKKIKKKLKDKTNRNDEYNQNKKNTIDIDYNYSYNKDNINNKKCSSIKQRTKNSRSLSIDHPRMRNILSKGYHIYNHNIKYRKMSNITENKNISTPSSNRTYITKTKYKDKYEKILIEIINTTNEYNQIENMNGNKVNLDNILNEYKSILYNNKIKNEFISELMNLYNKSHKLNLNVNNAESLKHVLNWIKSKLKEKENNEYKNLCMNIMKEYNLGNIEQLKIFIKKMLKKLNNNDNFLEGIKKILLP